MVIVRPIARADLEPLLRLAELTSFGLTSLPRDRGLLAQRIEDSLLGFEKLRHKPGGETYLFVMEDAATGAVVGTTGIVAKVGGFEPHWTYKLRIELHESDMLKVRKQVPTLHLSMEHNGPCEIGSLFLHPDHRGGGNGRLLSIARFLFMAEHPTFFDPTVIAEMRGVIDEQGRSPLWEALGRQFFDVEFPTADYLSVVNKRFIADLMPRHPIYIPLLPKEAQAVIGQVHEHTRPALRILEAEGFEFSGEVDIFEGGPVVSCPLTEIRAVKRSASRIISTITDEAITGAPYALANPSREFRACAGAVRVESDGTVALPRVTALALGLRVGQSLRCCELKPNA